LFEARFTLNAERITRVMDIRCQSPASRCGRFASWAAILVLATCLFAPTAATAADPFADSFASGGKKHPAHRVTKKTTRTTTKRRKPGRAAHPTGHGKRRPGRGAPAPRGGGDAFAAEPPAPEPQREEPARETSDRSSFDDDARARTHSNAEPEEAPRAEEPSEAEAEPPPRRAPPPRRPVKKHKRQSGEDGEGSDEDKGDEEDDATPYAAPAATPPVIVPREFTLMLGGAMMGRSFHFDIPLQRESSFPRIGYVAAIETYPLKLLGPGWTDGFGFAASYAAEVIGKASVSQTDGTSSSTSVKQSRWNLDLRYAFELGGFVVLAPDVGLASSSFTLSTDMPMMASQCPTTSATVCIPNTDVLLLQTGVHLRFALARELAVTLDGAFLQALSVKNKPLNQIGYEAGTSANGFSAALGGTYMLTDFLAVHGEIPFTRLTYSFHNPPPTPYKSASETYYGFSVVLAVFTD